MGWFKSGNVNGQISVDHNGNITGTFGVGGTF